MRHGNFPSREVGYGRRVRAYKSGSRYRWRLQAGNNEIIATGEEYTSKAAAQKGIDAVKRVAANAEVNDKTSE